MNQQLSFGDYELNGGLSFEECVALQQSGFGGRDIRETVAIQVQQMKELAWLQVEWTVTPPS